MGGIVSGVVLEPDTWSVLLDGRRVELTRKEYLVASTLARRRGMAFTLAQLADAAEMDVTASAYNIRSTIKRLRAKGVPIRTRYDIGYVID